MKMDDGELQSILRSEIDDAVSFIDTEIGADRAQALDYYRGRPFGDEEDGRSQVVSRDVHDTINAALPSLMRVFFGSENVVEFAPEGAEDIESAEQATDYVNYIVTNDNDGFQIFYAGIKDALRSKVGFIKYWWDDSVTVTTKTYSGLDEMGLTQLLEDFQKSLEAEVIESSEDEDGLSVKIRLKKRHDRVRIEAVPPEELLISREAKTIETARLVAHRTTKTVSDLVAMGYDRDEIEDASTFGDELEHNDERHARNPFIDGGDDSNDPTMRQVLYVEAYPFVDYDGDGIAELRRVCTVGSGYKVVSNEPWDERCFADLHCDPEPHTFFGQSMADKTMDVQRIKSVVLRAALDSLAQSIYPRTVVVENDGSVEDAQNTEVGAILRARTPTGYVALSTPDLSASALPYLSYMDELRENRTGMSKVSMGLDAEALQSTTATAAEGQFTRSQERIELIARIMASGVRKLFRGILKLVVENQRAQRVVKLRNSWTPVDPRAWRVSMDVVCTVGMGGGTEQQKAQLLALVASKQELIMSTAGFNNPLVTPKQYRNTLTKILELGGIKNPDAYFTDPDDPNVQAEAEEPPPDPKLVEAQMKGQLAQQEAAAKMQLAQQESASKLQLQAAEGQQKAAQAEQQAARDHELAVMKLEAEMALKREQISAELMLKREQLAAEIELKRELGLVNAQVAAETGMARAQASTGTSEVSPGGEPG
jgi:hypothetical protein